MAKFGYADVQIGDSVILSYYTLQTRRWGIGEVIKLNAKTFKVKVKHYGQNNVSSEFLFYYDGHQRGGNSLWSSIVYDILDDEANRHWTEYKNRIDKKLCIQSIEYHLPDLHLDQLLDLLDHIKEEKRK